MMTTIISGKNGHLPGKIVVVFQLIKWLTSIASKK
jgi:hypothetical protein